MPSKPAKRRVVRLTSTDRMNGITMWAAFLPETGECMLPTLRSEKLLAVRERDLYYDGCPVYQCWLAPMFMDDFIELRVARAKDGKGKK